MEVFSFGRQNRAKKMKKGYEALSFEAENERVPIEKQFGLLPSDLAVLEGQNPKLSFLPDELICGSGSPVFFSFLLKS